MAKLDLHQCNNNSQCYLFHRENVTKYEKPIIKIEGDSSFILILVSHSGEVTAEIKMIQSHQSQINTYDNLGDTANFYFLRNDFGHTFENAIFQFKRHEVLATELSGYGWWFSFYTPVDWLRKVLLDECRIKVQVSDPYSEQTKHTQICGDYLFPHATVSIEISEFNYSLSMLEDRKAFHTMLNTPYPEVLFQIGASPIKKGGCKGVYMKKAIGRLSMDRSKQVKCQWNLKLFPQEYIILRHADAQLLNAFEMQKKKCNCSERSIKIKSNYEGHSFQICGQGFPERLVLMGNIQIIMEQKISRKNPDLVSLEYQTVRLYNTTCDEKSERIVPAGKSIDATIPANTEFHCHWMIVAPYLHVR